MSQNNTDIEEPDQEVGLSTDTPLVHEEALADQAEDRGEGDLNEGEPEAEKSSGVLSLLWPSSSRGRLLRVGAVVLLGAIAAGLALNLPKLRPEGPKAPVEVDPKIAAQDRALVEDQPIETSGGGGVETPQPLVRPFPTGPLEDQAKTFIERGELAFRNRSYEEALQLLEEALRILPSTERVTRGRVFEDLAEVSRALGKESQARIFSERARELLREVFEPAHLLEAAEGKAAIGDWRAAQGLFARFLLLSGGLEGEGVALARRARMGLAKAQEAEWRATQDEQALDRLPKPDIHFGERR